MKHCLLLLLLILPLDAQGAEGDWPAWRGPRRDARSDATGLLKSWPDAGPKLLWTAQGLGEGFSTPSIAGKFVYLMGNKDGQEWVLAIDRTESGKGIWATPIGLVRRDGGGYPGPRSTPTVDDNRVFALGLNGDLVCLDAKSGKPYWQHDLVGEFGGEIGAWGYTESVLVDDKFVFCTPGGSQATMLGLLKTNGKPVWRATFGDPAGYASMIAVESGGTRQYVQFTSRGVVGVNAKNGSLLWRYDKPANGTANCATPLFVDNSVFAASNYNTGGGLVRLKKGRKTWEASEVYFTQEMNNHHGGMVLVDGYLYGSDNSILRCLDFQTGKTVWKDRSCGKCSLLYAEGMLYCRGEDGLVSLVSATPESFQLKGRFEQSQRSNRQAWPHPVIAGGCLYLRDEDRLLCYDVRSEK